MQIQKQTYPTKDCDSNWSLERFIVITVRRF